MSISPSIRRRQQQIFRAVRRVPGYHLAVQTVLPRVRRNAVLTDLVWRVFAPGHSVGQVPLALHGGRHISGPDVDRLPVVGILGTAALTQEQADLLVEHVAQLQQQHPFFRPLLILDRPALAAARTHGYVVELVVAQEDWARGDFVADRATGSAPGSWESYLTRRLSSLIEHYQLWHLAHVVIVDGIPQLDPIDEAVLARLHERLPKNVQTWATSSRPAQEDPAP